jgi:hypothetical protein
MSGLAGLSTSLTVIRMVGLLWDLDGKDPAITTLIAMYATLPAAAVGIAMTAWRLGCLREWWQYTEK